jgi:hypothetical protein
VVEAYSGCGVTATEHGSAIVVIAANTPLKQATTTSGADTSWTVLTAGKSIVPEALK